MCVHVFTCSILRVSIYTDTEYECTNIFAFTVDLHLHSSIIIDSEKVSELDIGFVWNIDTLLAKYSNLISMIL